MHHLTGIALFASLATSSLLSRDISTKLCKENSCENSYLTDVCVPGLGTADVNLEVPCNIKDNIALECIYGQKISVNKTGLEVPNTKTQSKGTQRLCICESQYWDALQGCEDCFEAHGAGQGLAIPHNVLSSMSSAYCAATATPRFGILDFQLEYLQKPQFSTILSSNSASATSTFSDPIGNKTDVSLYWTAAVTGTAILNVGEFTGTGTGTLKQSTVAVSDGQIVATAKTTAKTVGAAGTATKATGMTTGASQSAQTTTTSGVGARQTEAVFAGVLGFVGVVAML